MIDNSYAVYEWRQAPDGSDDYVTIGSGLTSSQAAAVYEWRYRKLTARGYTLQDVNDRSFNAFLHCRTGGAFRVKLYVEQVPVPLSVAYDY